MRIGLARHLSRSLATMCTPPKNSRSSKSSKSTPPEERLVLPRHNALKQPQAHGVEIIDTHTHVYSTFKAYRDKYPDGKHTTVKDFVQATLLSPETNRVHKVVDVWCEAENPFTRDEWNETVQSLSDLDGLDYHYVIGCHPHDAERYTPELEQAFVDAFSRKECVGWGEIGLDYHYDNSPREVQKDVLRRQLRAFLKTGLDKAVTIHTREADDDILSILTEELPRTTRIHIHCFTDSPSLASNLLSHFPHLYIGITGVVTFSSNLNTSQTLRDMLLPLLPRRPSPNPDLHDVETTTTTTTMTSPRFLLETDAPFMLPANVGPNSTLGLLSRHRFPFCTPAAIPWTAEFVANVLNEVVTRGEGGGGGPGADADAGGASESRRLDDEGNNLDDEEPSETGGGVGVGEWDTVRVLRVARENARHVYKI